MLLVTRVARLARLLGDPALREASLADWLKALSIFGLSAGIGAAVAPDLVVDLAADALHTFGIRPPAYFWAVSGDGLPTRIAFGVVVAVVVTALLVAVVRGVASLVRAALRRGLSGTTIALALVGLVAGVVTFLVPSVFTELLGIVLDPLDVETPRWMPDALQGGGWRAILMAVAVGLTIVLVLGTLQSAVRLFRSEKGGVNPAPPVILAISLLAAVTVFNDPWSALGVIAAIGSLVPFASPERWFLTDGGSTLYIAPHAAGSLAILAFLTSALVLWIAWRVARRRRGRRTARPVSGSGALRWGRGGDVRSAP